MNPSPALPSAPSPAPRRRRWGGRLAFLVALALLPFASLHARTARILSDALGVFPLQWFDRLPPEAAANVCLEWGEAFRRVGDEANAEAMRRDALNCLHSHRSLTPATYDAWLRVFPNDTLLLNNAACAYLFAEDNAPAALTLLRRIPLGERNAATLDTLATVLLRIGRPAEALQTLLQALESRPPVTRAERPLLLAHLGDALYANGFHHEALTAWRLARNEAHRLLPPGDTPIDLLPSGYDDTSLLQKIRALRRFNPPADRYNKL